MKKAVPIVVSLLLVVLLAGITLLVDHIIDRDRMLEVASLPDFVPSNLNNLLEQEAQTKDFSNAPNITLTDAQGNKVTLDQFRGKTVVINFWASWCGPSHQELAMFQQAYDEYKDQVHFLLVNTTSDDWETKEAADKMIAEYGFTFPIYYDLDASAANTYMVTNLPTSYFINAAGKAVAYAPDMLTRLGFEQGLEACELSMKQIENNGTDATPDGTTPDGTTPDSTVPTEETE